MTRSLAALRPRAPELTEAAWSRQVVGIARSCGYLVFHAWLSARSQPGYPDLTLVRPWPGRGRVIFVELKSRTGTVRAEQRTWLEGLRAAGAEAYLWRPRPAQEIADLLSLDQRPERLEPFEWEAA